MIAYQPQLPARAVSNKIGKACNTHAVTQTAENRLAVQVGNTDGVGCMQAGQGNAIAAHRVNIGLDAQWIKKTVAQGAKTNDHGIRLQAALVGFDSGEFALPDNELAYGGTQVDLRVPVGLQPLRLLCGECQGVADFVTF